MAKNKGYIKLYRDIMDSDIWDNKEPFDKRSAWIDLIMMANHADNEIIVGNHSLTIKRGQAFTSIRKLAVRWHWGTKRTLAYIRLLEECGMVYRYVLFRGTLLTLINYGKYQNHGNTIDHTTDNAIDNASDYDIDNATDSQTIKKKNVYINDKRMNKKAATPFEDF